jgi:REP-associated tyrosine transposase
MPGSKKLTFDTIYHIWNRCVNRSTIFASNENYRFFLQQYIQHIEPVARTYAYCLPPNHFHFAIRTRTAENQIEYRRALGEGGELKILEPSQAFSNLCNSYVRSFNCWHKRSGGLFEGRFGRKPVEDGAYLIRLIVYIHQNPQHHRLVDDFRDWPYSSYNAFLAEGKRTRIDKETVMSWFDGLADFEAAHWRIVTDLNLGGL